MLRDEFDRTLKELKDRKAPKVDKMPGKIPKKIRTKAKHYLFHMTNEVCKVSQDFETKRIMSIPKASTKSKICKETNFTLEEIQGREKLY